MKELKDLKIKDLKDLREMEAPALKKEFVSSSKNLFILRMKKELGEQKQTHIVKVLRRYIAQIQTVANEKNINLA